MLSKEIKGILEKNQYRMVGKHSAVQICPWTKKSLRGEDVCWKERFYGVKSHGCCQMTPIVICENKCLHCWRPIEYNLGTEIEKIDEPKKIIDGIIRERKKLLMGFKGSKKTNIKKFKEALEPSLFAFSLLGESTLYPKLAELIKEVRKRNAVSFLVTNGLNPEKIKELAEKKCLPTQLTASVNAPNKKLYKKICRSSKKNAWKKLNETLKLMPKLRCRTVVRLTLIKELNMDDKNSEEYAKQYAELIKTANPLFIHVKGFVCRGYSKKRLSQKNMPSHKEVKDYAKKLLKFLKNYRFLDEKFESRVVLFIEIPHSLLWGKVRSVSRACSGVNTRLLGKDRSRMKIKESEV